jgi:DNA-binding CsgD family transcriptional regulator
MLCEPSFLTVSCLLLYQVHLDYRKFCLVLWVHYSCGDCPYGGLRYPGYAATLNNQLVLLLKSHTYLAVYDNMSQSQQTDIVNQIKTLDPLTPREEEVLQLILAGQSNREIAGTLSISESTVKTHVRNIFSKYDVGSRAELISTLLKNQRVE